ncbi:MAG: Na+/H+ antiporter NhaC family protein [Planctomycetota bacterium]
MEHSGLWSLVPTFIVLIVALATHRTFEALLCGALLGYVIVDPSDFFSAFVDSLLNVMQDPTIGWIILVCGLFGSLIHLLVASGGATAFANSLLGFVKTRRSALIVTWLLGLVLFIDDYLNALTIGSSMKPVTDKFRVSREMLAYIVDSTAAPVCVLVPLSTWAIYVAGLLESNGLAETGQGLEAYVKAIPFAIYGWIAALTVPLVAWGVIPPLGAMRRAELRAAEGELAPPNSEAITLDIPQTSSEQTPRLAYFALPIVVLIGATVYFEIDALKGVLVATAFTVAMYVGLRLMTFASALDSVFAGFKTMLYALAIIVMSFVLKAVNDELGLTLFVIETVSPWLSRALLPAVVFVTLSGITFSTGSFWGVYAVSLPIVIPLAQSLEVHPWLAIGAVVSSGAFGSHACFYGDASVLSASAAGCNNMAHVLTQLPYALLAAAISTVIFVALGYVY